MQRLCFLDPVSCSRRSNSDLSVVRRKVLCVGSYALRLPIGYGPMARSTFILYCFADEDSDWK